MSLNRILAWAAPLALALFVVAPQASAISELSQFKCLQPSAAAEDVFDFFQGMPTGDFEQKDCKKLCNGLEGLCKRNSKIRLKCVKDDDKFWARLSHGLCGDDSECKDSVKEDAKACKEDLKVEAEDSKEGCREVKAFCEDSCGEGGLFELEG